MTTSLVDRLSGISEGLAVKVACRVATTASITLAGLQTIDGVTLTEGNRVLVKDQVDATLNGIYAASSGNWSRASDFDGVRDVVQGTQVSVFAGTTQAGQTFYVSTSSPVIGSTAIAFSLNQPAVTQDLVARYDSIVTMLDSYYYVPDYATPQACLDAAALTGGQVMFGPGRLDVAGTLLIKSSGIRLRGVSGDTTRSAHAKFPTRILWTGADDGVLFDIDPESTGLIRYTGFEDMTLDGNSKPSVILVRTNAANTRGTMKNVTMRVMDVGVKLSDGAVSWFFERVICYGFTSYGWWLPVNNHNTTFTHCISESLSTQEGLASVLIGDVDNCSNVNFFGCAMQANVIYQIDAQEVRSLGWFGGYQETIAGTTRCLANFKLGDTSSSAKIVEGFTLQGGYFTQGTSQLRAILVAGMVSAADISGCHFVDAYANSIIQVQNSLGTRNKFRGNIIGTNKVFSGNSADSALGWNEGGVHTRQVADDGVIVLTPPANYAGIAVGKLDVWIQRQPGIGGAVLYDAAGAGVSCTKIYGTSNFTATTGALAGTTGADGDLTVATHTDGKVYIENRTGGANPVFWRWCEADDSL